MPRSSVRFGLGLAVLGALSLGTKTSHAQAFYEQGEISVALERAFGIHYVNMDVDRDGPGADENFHATAIGLGWGGAVTPLHWTRVAVDGFITDRLSLGGSLAFYTQSGDVDGSGFLFAPRIGYAVPISRAFTFWPRGGFSYYDQDENSLFAFTGEAMFVASPSPDWGVLFGLTLDLGVLGDAPNDGKRSGIAIGFPAVGLLTTF